jgi:hypothetical protein
MDGLFHIDRFSRLQSRWPIGLLPRRLQPLLTVEADQFCKLVFLRQFFFLHPLFLDFFGRRENMALLQLVEFKVQAMVGCFEFPELVVGVAKLFDNRIFRQHYDTSWLK